MKNFARIIDLGHCECLAYRSGYTEVVFRFWLNGLTEEDEVLEPEAKMEFRLPQVVDSFFGGENEHKLKEKAEKAWEKIQEQFGELMQPAESGQ